MKMQDSEFDELLRSKLNDFELEPSAKVWPEVDRELAAGRRKKALLPFLSIAASIIVLVSAGILFIPQKAVVPVKHPVPNKITKIALPVNNIAIAKSNLKPAVLKPHGNNGLVKTNRPVNKTIQPRVKSPKNVAAQNTTLIAKQESPVKNGEQPVTASAFQKPEVANTTVNNDNDKLSAKQPEELNSNPGPGIALLPVADKQSIAAIAPKHKIHTLGDLINVVVAKVDKRKDKIIEFTNTDDDDQSSVTGINLGIIKLKKDQKDN